MATEDHALELVEKLIEATKAGRVSWNEEGGRASTDFGDLSASCCDGTGINGDVYLAVWETRSTRGGSPEHWNAYHCTTSDGPLKDAILRLCSMAAGNSRAIEADLVERAIGTLGDLERRSLP